MRVLAAVEVGGVGCARHLRVDHWHRYCHHHDFNSDIIAIMMISCMAVIDMAIVIFHDDFMHDSNCYCNNHDDFMHVSNCHCNHDDFMHISHHHL